MTRTCNPGSCLALWAALWLTVGCGMAAEDSAGLESPNDYAKTDAATGARQCYGANDCAPGYGCNQFGTCVPLAGADGGVPGGDSGLPDEVENEADPPAAGKDYVYVAVSGQDMVAKIHSLTLAVRSIAVGKDPTALRTV